jgi:transcriptional regulator with XRE-family HTH domain
MARREDFIRRRKGLGFTQESFAQAASVDRSTVGRWESGDVTPQAWQRPALMRILRASAAELDALIGESAGFPAQSARAAAVIDSADEDELEALDLVRRASASDVGSETLARLELAFNELATEYPTVPPRELMGRVRKYSSYVTRLMDAKKTLAEHRQLLVLGGWFSLLGAVLHIDLNQQDAATARLGTAMALAQHADHREIQAWCFETDAWRVLTSGDYVKAAELAGIAQRVAPRGSSVEIQAIAQQGRAFARIGDSTETYTAIGRVHSLSASAGLPDQPGHHFRYDPAKSVAYTATALSWIGDPAAETYARSVIAQLSPPDDLAKWPRRSASAHIDLALSLVSTDRLDEACEAARRAMLSGRVAPSNHWRALEVLQAVETRRISDAKDLREVYNEMRLEIEATK